MENDLEVVFFLQIQQPREDKSFLILGAGECWRERGMKWVLVTTSSSLQGKRWFPPEAFQKGR